MRFLCGFFFLAAYRLSRTRHFTVGRLSTIFSPWYLDFVMYSENCVAATASCAIISNICFKIIMIFERLEISRIIEHRKYFGTLLLSREWRALVDSKRQQNIVGWHSLTKYLHINSLRQFRSLKVHAIKMKYFECYRSPSVASPKTYSSSWLTDHKLIIPANWFGSANVNRPAYCELWIQFRISKASEDQFVLFWCYGKCWVKTN